MRYAAIVAVFWLLLLAVGTSAAGAEPFGGGPEPSEGLLILRNGQIISGRITNLGEYYSVVLPEGELRLRRSEVEFACRDLADAYQRKRSLIARDNTLEHLQLAQWCVRHGLLEEAAAEIAAARRLEPNHPLIAAVERRLEAALQPAPPPVRQESTDTEVTVEQLERMMRELPPGSVETFTRLVQPLLMNSCAAGGCHGPQAEKFPLLRVPSGKPVTRRITQRNIYQALKYVDARKPEASPLLTVPLQPHGNASAPIFTDRNAAQHERLVQWVMEVTGRSQSHAPATVSRHPLAGISAVQASEPGYYFPDPPNSPNNPHSAAQPAKPGSAGRLRLPTGGAGSQAAQPGPDQPGPVHPGPVQPAPVQPAPQETSESNQGEVGTSGVRPTSYLKSELPTAPNVVEPVAEVARPTSYLQSELPTDQASDGRTPPGIKPNRLQAGASKPGKSSGPLNPPGKLVQPVVPADPFDPEVFNRRYFGR